MNCCSIESIENLVPYSETGLFYEKMDFRAISPALQNSPSKTLFDGQGVLFQKTNETLGQMGVFIISLFDILAISSQIRENTLFQFQTKIKVLVYR